MSDTTREPVLWALDFGGEPLHPDLVFASAEEAENNKRHTISYCQIVPLYRDPPPSTLTDAEREALEWAAEAAESEEDGGRPTDAAGGCEYSIAIRALLARLGGEQ